ncbi:MAG: hypothetical protein QXI12_01980 [Candidatus Methanomethyliaceae archaeon]
MNEKIFIIATALARYYRVPEPSFSSAEECFSWVNSVLQGNNSPLKPCPSCQARMSRRLVDQRLILVCNRRGKTASLTDV